VARTLLWGLGWRSNKRRSERRFIRLNLLFRRHPDVQSHVRDTSPQVAISRSFQGAGEIKCRGGWQGLEALRKARWAGKFTNRPLLRFGILWWSGSDRIVSPGGLTLTASPPHF